jgi:NAD(P)H-hydrate epimerase
MRHMKHESHPPPLSMTRDQVRAFDAWAIREIGIPGAILMENAGRGCAAEIHDRYGQERSLHITVACGTGNNGGDGFVIARHLSNRGHRIRVLLCGDRHKVKGDARLQLEILERMQGSDLRIASEAGDFRDSDLLVDALFGTGLAGAPRDPYPAMIDRLNRAGRPIVSVDIPSGLDCNTGRPWGPVVQADLTVTFVCLKQGFLSEASRAYTGHVRVASIGIEPALWPARQNTPS